MNESVPLEPGFYYIISRQDPQGFSIAEWVPQIGMWFTPHRSYITQESILKDFEIGIRVPLPKDAKRYYENCLSKGWEIKYDTRLYADGTVKGNDNG